MGPKLVINWRYFSLEQVNNQKPGWKLWKQDEDKSRGLLAFHAAEAARRQGEDAFYRFHMALLKAKHEQFLNIADRATLLKVGQNTGLEMRRFQEDLADRRLLSRLAEDHTFAAESLKIFGTPTLVFPLNRAIFLKMSDPPPAEDSLDVFSELYHLVERRQYIEEVKRP